MTNDVSISTGQGAATQKMLDAVHERLRITLFLSGAAAAWEWQIANGRIVGIFPDHASAVQAWRTKAQATVDNAHMRYFIAHLHRLLDPTKGER